MTNPSKTVRVFISSTFRDMHAERDHLVTVVFPELRERVEQVRLEFFDAGMRLRRFSASRQRENQKFSFSVDTLVANSSVRKGDNHGC